MRALLAAGQDLYTLDADALRAIDRIRRDPDLCAVCAVDVSEVDQALDYLGCRAMVVTLDPMTLTEVLASIAMVGRATDTTESAAALVRDLQGRLQRIAAAVAGRPRPRLAVLEWTDPPFSAGHWVPDMVTAAGAESVLGVAGQRSQQIEWAAVEATQPDVIVVAPCGYRLDGARQLAEEMVERGVVPRAYPCGRWMPTPPSYDRAPGWSTGSRRWPISRTCTVNAPDGMVVRVRGGVAV